jgi:hypothetical protein
MVPRSDAVAITNCDVVCVVPWKAPLLLFLIIMFMLWNLLRRLVSQAKLFVSCRKLNLELSPSILCCVSNLSCTAIIGEEAGVKTRVNTTLPIIASP